MQFLEHPNGAIWFCSPYTAASMGPHISFSPTRTWPCRGVGVYVLIKRRPTSSLYIVIDLVASHEAATIAVRGVSIPVLVIV